MKLKDNYTEVQVGLGEKTIQAGISMEKFGKLWDMLQNPYKNNIGSIVREITSNCFDSHIEAAVTDAVRIKYAKDESGYYVSFIDVGIGMSVDRVETIFKDYLASTKEESNDFIGCFGIGSKSPLSYQDLFYITTRYEGIEYHYIMRKGKSSPEIDLLKKKATTERNGTEIKLYIKNESDVVKFLKETFTQLHYFKNVVFDLDSLKQHLGYYSQDSLDKLQEDYKLIEGNTFIMRTNTYLKELHMCIGDVYYPIDWPNLGIPRIPFDQYAPALKFDIGELDVIQTREDVRYTDEVIIKIRTRINEFKEELKNKYNTNASNGEMKLDEFVKYCSYNQNVLLLDGQYELALKNLIDEKELVPIQIKDFPYQFKTLAENRLFDRFFVREEIYNIHGSKSYALNNNIEVVKTFKSNGAIKSPTNSWNIFGQGNTSDLYGMIYSTNLSSYRTYYTTETENYSVKKNKYLHNVLHQDKSPENIEIIKIPKALKFTKGSFIRFHKYLQKSIKTDVKTTKEILDYFLKQIKEKFNERITGNYDIIQVNETWWKKFQADNRKIAVYDRTEMTVQKFYLLNAAWDRINKTSLAGFYETRHNITVLLTKDEQAKYCSGNNDRSSRLERLFLYRNSINKKAINLYSTADRNYKKIIDNRPEGLPIFTLEEFINDKKMQTRVLGKIATVLKIKNYIDTVFNVEPGLDFKDFDDIIHIMNPVLQEHYKSVYDLIQNSYKHFDEKDMSAILEDFDNLDTSAMIYDRDLLNSFNIFLEFVEDSQLKLVHNTFNSIFAFTKRYRPSKTVYMLNSVLYRTTDHLEYIAKTKAIVFLPEDDDDKKLSVIKAKLKYYEAVNHSINRSYSYSSSYNTLENRNSTDNVLTLILMDYVNLNRKIDFLPEHISFELEKKEEAVEDIEVEEELEITV
jgi:hypothetical protein